MLRLTISRPICLGVKHPSGAKDQIFITVRQWRVRLRRTSAEGTISMSEFWKNFNIKQDIENVYESRQEVTANTMKAVWISDLK
jgi:hypothetical protein